VQEEGLSGLEGLLAVVGRRDRGKEFQILGAVTLKLCVDKGNREVISVGDSEGTSGMTGMQG